MKSTKETECILLAFWFRDLFLESGLRVVSSVEHLVTRPPINPRQVEPMINNGDVEACDD